MGFLLDTNVLSEMRKQARANANVLQWAARNRASDLFLSALVIGEVRRGIEAVRTRDPVQAGLLDTWLATVIASFGPRILPVTVEIADVWGRLSAPDRLPHVDGLLAATMLPQPAQGAVPHAADDWVQGGLRRHAGVVESGGGTVEGERGNRAALDR